jgi:PPOX class probable F420-dependent enzyme
MGPSSPTAKRLPPAQKQAGREARQMMRALLEGSHRFLCGRRLVYMSMKLNDAAKQLLDGPHTAVVATTNADGRPQSSVIFVKRDGDTVVFSTIKGRLKTRNMMRDPRISLLVLANAGRYVEIRGTVEITEDPDKVLLREMYERYMGGKAPPPEPEAKRLIVRITPEKLYVWPPAS